MKDIIHFNFCHRTITALSQTHCSSIALKLHFVPSVPTFQLGESPKVMIEEED